MRTKAVAIVPAAGLGKRFGTSARKPFAKVAGVPLLIYSLKRFQEEKSIEEIIPVLRKEDIKIVLELIENNGLNKINQIATGGKERQDSVHNALRLINDDCLILIHDGVRPLVSAGLIERLLQEMKGPESARNEIDGVVPGLPMKETLKEVDTEDLVLSTVQRDKFLAIQTPQVFPSEVIKKAYDVAFRDGFHATDDSALVERTGGRVRVIMGDPFNIKVTTPEDMDMVEYILKKINL
ncbi:MAG: 2-C-methyl-D-erythritol 4-phosphate cytidylyltransferase [Thermodesulfovibrionia bacterium]